MIELQFPSFFFKKEDVNTLFIEHKMNKVVENFIKDVASSFLVNLEKNVFHV